MPAPALLHASLLPWGTTRWQRRQLPVHIADELRLARQRLELSQRQVARLARISSPYLSRLERGLRAPRMPVAVRLAEVLSLDGEVMEELLDEAVVGCR